jgi:hypothetical protein
VYAPRFRAAAPAQRHPLVSSPATAGRRPPVLLACARVPGTVCAIPAAATLGKRCASAASRFSRRRRSRERSRADPPACACPPSVLGGAGLVAANLLAHGRPALPKEAS